MEVEELASKTNLNFGVCVFFSIFSAIVFAKDSHW